MERREFLISGAVVAGSVCLEAEAVRQELPDVPLGTWEIIGATLEHIFPEGSALPSARSMKLIDFVHQTLMHPTYDRDIRRFVLEGAQTLDAMAKGKFASMRSEAKEKILRDYEQNSNGRQWLQRIMILGMEGMFGDPVYGSNLNKAGWNALKTSGGEPSPLTRYIRL